MSSTARLVSVPDEALEHLRSADPVMAALIGAHGAVQYRQESDLWRSLVRSIVGQQLSVKAAATILGRVADLGDGVFPGPEFISTVSDEALRACGLSRPKMSYIRDLSRRWLIGDVAPETLWDLSDEEVIEHLTRVRGIGRWTAEMVLIFSLGRPDVLAVDDQGLRNGAQHCYGLKERPGGEELARIGEPWRPYRSFASLYLWESLKS